MTYTDTFNLGEPDAGEPEVAPEEEAGLGGGEPVEDGPVPDEPLPTRRSRRAKGAKAEEPRARRRAPSAERRIVERTLAVAALTDLERDVLAAACDTEQTEVAELTLACLAAEASATAALELVLEVAGADALAAGAIAAGAAGERGGIRLAWMALRRLSTALPAQVPSKAVAAGTAFATAAQGLLDGSELETVRALVEALSTGAGAG